MQPRRTFLNAVTRGTAAGLIISDWDPVRLFADQDVPAPKPTGNITTDFLSRFVNATNTVITGVDVNLTRRSRNQTGKFVTMPEWASNY